MNVVALFIAAWFLGGLLVAVTVGPQLRRMRDRNTRATADERWANR